MNTWLMVILAATAGGVVSLIGGIYLLYGRFGVQKIQRIAVPFAAGALLAAAFVDLLPEAVSGDNASQVLFIALMGFIAFFLLERFLHWFHHHHEHADESESRRSSPLLIIVGDTLHNFIDGLAIGVAFLVSPATGIVTAIAIAAHEIPQEIGDFGLLLSKGMVKRKILIVNVFSAFATVIGAVLAFGIGDSLPVSESALLALAAGFFLYIAASDIIPTIHAETRAKIANIQALVLLLGVAFVTMTTVVAHEYIGHSHDHSEHTHEEHDDHHDH